MQREEKKNTKERDIDEEREAADEKQNINSFASVREEKIRYLLRFYIQMLIKKNSELMNRNRRCLAAEPKHHILFFPSFAL